MRQTDLLRQATTFIGREASLAAVEDLLGSTARLLVITGPAGIGKTRLAMQYALRRVETARGGRSATSVCWCDLTEARDLDGIGSALAAALQIPLTSTDTSEEVVERVARAIASRGRILMILDNFEQVVNFASASIGRWMAAASSARFLVTSRERLRLPSEHVHELTPLVLPEHSVAAEESEAVRLLLDRVRTIRRDYVITPHEAPIVAEIVRQLDGIPLAIELAAARMAVFGPRAVLERLPRRLDLLGHGARDASSREGTLRGAIDWSWDLLEPWERVALAQCSVFRGGFSLEAAEQVLDLSSQQAAPPVVDIIQALREKSLLRAMLPFARSPRFGFYLCIREYAAEKLTADPSNEVIQGRHATYYTHTGHQWARETDVEPGGERREALVVEQENLLASIEWALSGSNPTVDHVRMALHGLLGLAVVVADRGPLPLERRLLETALGMPAAPSVEPALRAEALTTLGNAERLLGDLSAAARHLHEAIALAEGLQHPSLEATARIRLGSLLFEKGGLDEAVPQLDRALELGERSGDALAQGRAIGMLGVLAISQGRLDEALERQERAAELLRSTGNERDTAITLDNLGVVYMVRGAFDEAEQRFEEARAIQHRLGNRTQELMAAGHLAVLAHMRGRLEHARRMYEEIVVGMREVGRRHYEGMFHGYLGILCHEQGRLPEARRSYGFAVQILKDLGVRLSGAVFSAHRAVVEAASGDIERAERMLSDVEKEMLPTDPAAARAIVQVQRAHIELGLAAQAMTAGDNEQAALHRGAAQRIVAAAERSGGKQPSLLSSSGDLRLTMRLLDRAFEADRLQQVSARVSTLDLDAEENLDTLIVHWQGDWFRPPRGKRITCDRRQAARRLLVKLTQQRVEAPGVAIESDMLLEVGWPGERIAAKAARNRLYVTLATLRKLGLKGILRATEEGYMLEPKVQALFVADG